MANREQRIKLNNNDIIQLKKIKSNIILRIFNIIISYIIICYIIFLIPITAFILIPILSFILSGFLNAAHFYLHRTDISSMKKNIICRVWCIPILINYSSFKMNHLKHHKITGTLDDPDIHPKCNNIFRYIYTISGINIWINIIKSILTRIFWNAKKLNSEKKSIYIDNIMIFIWLIFIITISFLYPKLIIIYYLLPLVFYPLMLSFFSLPEHYGLNGIKDITMNTRTIISNKIVRYYQWNANYHVEHHYYPNIPTINLHILHEKIKFVILNQDNGYLSFHIKILKDLYSKKSS